VNTLRIYRYFVTGIKKKEGFVVNFGDIFGDILVSYVYFGVQIYIYIFFNSLWT